MLGCEDLEATRGLEPVTDPPAIPKLIAEIPIAVDVRAAAAKNIPPGEGGPARRGSPTGEEPTAGGPPTVPPPADAPPPGEPEQPPTPINDPPPPQPPVTEPSPEAPLVQASVTELEPATAPPPVERLAVGTMIYAPAGPLQIASIAKLEWGVQYYDVYTWDGRKVQLQEASGEAAWRLQGEAALVSSARVPLQRVLLDRFELGGRYYVVTEIVGEPRPDDA